MAGKRFLPLDVYDGAEGGENVYTTATVIGQSSTAVDDLADDSPIAEAGFAGLRHWPTTISYFEKRVGGDSTPSFVMSFVLYENGIGRKLRMDRGDLVLLGTMTHLEILLAPSCP